MSKLTVDICVMTLHLIRHLIGYISYSFDRKEFNTIRTQYIDAGFSVTGLSSGMTVRRTFNSANMSVTYSPDQNQFVLNHTHPLQSNVSVEIRRSYILIIVTTSPILYY